MAGGVGSRFWPMSRPSYPKQFLDILNTGKTLLQSTFHRFNQFIPASNIYVVTSGEYVDIVRDQLPHIPVENIIGEPERKNTAACIALIANIIQQRDKNAKLIVAPSDHHISDSNAFAHECINALEMVGKHETFVTFGIKPTYANTGYGYIETSTKAGEFYQVERFTEKPELKLAEQFIQQGNYFWNSGIFIWKTSDILKAFEKYSPEISKLFAPFLTADSQDTSSLMQLAYAQSPSISIDYAILEKADNILMLSASFDWSDLGTWNSAWENQSKTEALNVQNGEKLMVFDSTECIIHSSEKKLILVGGVQNLIVVNTENALLICDRSREQEIKTYLNKVKEVVSEANL